MKTAISLTDDTFHRVDHAAKRLGVSRSEFFAQAAERWLDALEDDGTTEAIDRAIAGLAVDHGRRSSGPNSRRSDLMVRGEVWWADLGLPRGSAPALRRPVLIVSADQYNRSKLRTVTVVVLTTTGQLAALPGNVAVAADLTGTETDSVIDVTQIATVDRAALEERICVLPDWTMAQADAGLGRALALTHL